MFKRILATILLSLSMAATYAAEIPIDGILMHITINTAINVFKIFLIIFASATKALTIFPV